MAQRLKFTVLLSETFRRNFKYLSISVVFLCIYTCTCMLTYSIYSHPVQVFLTSHSYKHEIIVLGFLVVVVV